MPLKPKRPCNHIGCNELTTDGYCEKHFKLARKQYDNTRGTASQRGYNSRWRKYRSHYLKEHPLCMCRDCEKRVVPLPANVVDHITPHKGDHKLFWDPKNHQAMNDQCHNRKTATEDGGFGNGRK